MPVRAPNFDRIFAFIAFVMSRRAPVHVDVVAEETGCSRATVYRRIEQMRRHFPIDVRRGVVTVRRTAPHWK